MAEINASLTLDEKSWQNNFYDALFGEEKEKYLHMDRSTDGYTDGILFEHKLNVTSYGQNRVLSQALIYLCRFNRDGIPVPAKICLVSQEEQKCYIYETADYLKWVEDIEGIANLKASEGIVGFSAGKAVQVIPFGGKLRLADLREINEFISKPPEKVKVHVTEHNVYGWSGYYYANAERFRQKPEKKAFFRELRDPVGALRGCIEPWEGTESDFKYIMDMLNDPMTQKKLGAFYTPPQYAELAAGLVQKAIQRALEAGKKDYIILDRCAGTGNLEMFFDDEVLSHVIVSTYELKEWMVLKDRFGERVRYIIPPIPAKKGELPGLNHEGFLSGANALTRDIVDNPVVRQYLDDDDCAVILFENPPYVETTGIEFQKKKSGKQASDWKSSYVVQEMKKEVKGTVSNDMANAFIWSGFQYFLRQDTDSYIVFSPIKYWKAQHLVNKKFLDGYAFNRRHFHAATDACVVCAYWSNENSTELEFRINAINLDNDGKLTDEGSLTVKKVFSLFSSRYYDQRSFPSDVFNGIAAELDGTESHRRGKDIQVSQAYNPNIIGYMVAKKHGLDNPRLSSNLLIAGKYDGHGFYLRNGNFMEKLPMFAATRYPDHCNDWKVMSMIMKSADGAERYEADVRSGKLKEFLFRTMFWCCLSHYPHMRSLHGSDGRLYLNQLCFDGDDTLGSRKLVEFVDGGYRLSDTEKTLLGKMKEILGFVRENCKEEYNPQFKYGLYQIDEEINVKVVIGKNADGSDKMGFKYGDLNNMIKELKGMVKQYYVENLVGKLFEYEFLK